ncbi:hypothetical protein LTR48_000005 [Friedmanniomyces endolithicus]|uniref:MMS19 nucleotide excision repair protein n=1 Tax=Rachicladosporium monterosium TaxID=1507873 RepID=A0ABR0LH95_9PEZI|nr:hypothetical protein LTR48_000005 [Friedmanniomyces endolithicus]KAK5148715.1 hypothetical protein LTR32_000073 [Rachicladosporium monterosium]
MSDIQLYLLEADSSNKTEAQGIAARTASRLQQKTLKLIDLVTSLEPHINDKDNGSIRANSVAYLADVIAALPLKVLSVQERRLLCDFILGRLEGDTEGVGASARALVALEGLGKWDTPTAQKVLRAFLDNTHPLRQFKLQTERYAVVQLIDLLVAKYRDAMRKLHNDDHEFMAGFISYWEGEKDPRNLMIIFSLLQVPMTEWDVHAHAQDLFDSVFNYFPITFKPPPDDPYGITSQDLKNRLRDCIAANSDFAPYAFPQLLDKLDSTSMNTKRDVLQALQACITDYEAKTINLYSVTLWDALKFEILNVQEEDLAEEALTSLALLAAKFSYFGEGPLNAYLRPIIKECNEHLEDAPTKQSEAAGRILHALVSSAPQAADKVSKGILPVLFALYNGSESITRRRGLLQAFNQITGGFEKMTGEIPGADCKALQAFADDALAAMVRALVSAPKAEVSFRMASLTGLAQLVSVPGLLSDKQINQAVDTVTNLVLHEQLQGHGDIRTPAIKALSSMALNVPQAVRDRSVPAFMVELPDVPEGDVVPSTVLEAFAQLAAEGQIFDTVVLRLKNKLRSVRHQGASLAYQRALLFAMLYAFTFGSPARDDGVIRSAYYADYADPLTIDFVKDVSSETDPVAVDVVGRIANIILRPQSVHLQSTVYHKAREWLSPANADESGASQHTTPFLLYFYAAMRPEVVEAADVVSMLKAQTVSALSAGASSQAVVTTLRLVSLLVNKFANPKTMQATLAEAGLDVEILTHDSPSAEAIQAAFAVTKGLLIQGKSGSLTTRYLQTLLDLLSGPNSTTTAQNFTTLLAPDEILSKENHCLISGLSQQKLFNQAIPTLTTAIRTATPAQKPAYLTALTGLLRHLPYTLLSPSLTLLTPPLLQTLDLTSSTPDQAAKASALIIFESALMHDAPILTEHTSSLITRLLNSTSTSANGAGVRAKALQCLALVPRQLKREAVVPFRREVVRRLLACLDDGKRSVRGEAVRCRTAWLGLDEGGEEED